MLEKRKLQKFVRSVIEFTKRDKNLDLRSTVYRGKDPDVIFNMTMSRDIYKVYIILSLLFRSHYSHFFSEP